MHISLSSAELKIRSNSVFANDNTYNNNRWVHLNSVIKIIKLLQFISGTQSK